MDNINRLSKFTLVACDQAYDRNILEGSRLAAFPDSPSPGTPDLYPNSMPPNFTDPIFVGLSEWAVINKVTDSSTGFGATIYVRDRDGKKDYMVALQGTRGLNAQDWGGNLLFAMDKWTASTGGQALMTFLTEPGKLAQITGDIYFTGQSAGGALAEYAAYEFKAAALAQRIDFSNDRIALVTFNGLGGIAGLQDQFVDFNPKLLAGSTTRHYWVVGDLVHRLGAGTAALNGEVHLNGIGNEYRLDFYAEGNLPDGTEKWLSVDDAHRIETGSYAGLNNNPDFLFSTAPKDAVVPLQVTELARFGSGFGNLFNADNKLTYGEATTRLFATLLYGLAYGNSAEVRELVSAIAESLYQTGAISQKKYSKLILKLPRIMSDFAKSDAGVRAQVSAVILAQFLEMLETTDIVSTDLREEWNKTVTLLGQKDLFGANPRAVTSEQALSFILNKAVGKSLAQFDYGSQVALRVLVGTMVNAQEWPQLRSVIDAHKDELIDIFYAEDDFVDKSIARIKVWAVEQGADGYVLSRQMVVWIAILGEELTGQIGHSSAFVESTLSDLKGAINDYAKSAANAYNDFLQKYTDPVFAWGEQLTFSALKNVAKGLTSVFDLLSAPAFASALPDTLKSGFEDAVKNIQSAGQTIVIAQGRPQNPFDAETFDPDGTPVALGAILEGEVKAFTVFLPYEAQEGGQHVSLVLGGAAAGKFVVLLDADPIELSDDGEFDLLIDEGSRSISFGLWAQGDVDTDETLSLSATLVDAEGNATHLTHLELNLALDAEDEAPPMGGREIRGDWAPKPYTDPVTGETFAYRWDELSNVERDSGVPNTTGFSEPDNKLDGSPGPDHIVTGDYEDRAYGFEGDDSITGSALLINILHGGAGNDWIEALGSSSHATDYFEFELDGRVIKLGQGKISGGAGDDYIYGESAESLDRLYDPATLPTGLPGNWSSGGTGDDHIYGSAGDDVLMGGIGKDLLVGGAGQDVLLGDDSYWLYSDMVLWRVVHPYFNDSTAGLGGFELGLFPVVNATLSYPDQVYRITGDPDFTYYKNGGADDVLIGGAGRDILIGQYGDDTLYGGGDDDILAGWEGNDELYGGDGDDLMAGDFGRYEQPNQRNVVAPWLAPAGVRNLVNSDGSVVDQSGRDFLDGGAGNDILFGEGGDDILLGGAGNDTLYGDASYLLEELHGADTLDGGAGNDVLYGHGGIDRLYGGSGDDVLDGGAGNDFLYGSSGNDSLSGGDGDDALDGGDGDDILLGGAGNDILLGGAGNDQLDGGDGDDVLFAGEGENRLEGGDGNDTLYGGSLGDIVSGGAGNDRIDAGAGIDIVYGGEGNDTYVLDFNYGRDLFEDAEGANRIEFGAGIAPEQITAEWAGSALTVAYGFGEDAFTVDLAQFQLGGIDFADGTSWTKKNLVNVAPRVLTAGSDAAETVEGVLYGRNDLQGLGGNDLIMGAGYDDLLSGGAGADTLDGAGGSDRYFFTADESGIDRISDSELAGRAYLDWFYENLGIADWEGRALHGGKFEVSFLDEGGDFTFYYDTYEEAFTDYPEAIITHIEPLPEATPPITRNDTDALDQLVNAGVLARDVVEFGPGLTLADLELSINVDGTLADQHPEQPWYGGGTLKVRWGDAGFDLQIPDVNYGFVGSNLLTDGIDSSYDESAGSWRGYRLGEGVETFEFTDGGTYSLEEILQQATVVARYGYEFLRGSGYQVIDRNQDSVCFEAGIQASEVQVTSNGTDLLITLTDGSAQGRIVDWYADPAAVPSITLRFADGSELDTDSITRLGLTRYGTEAPDFLQAESDFAHALYGLGGPDTLIGLGGNDFLDGGEGDDYLYGGAGDDTYVFSLGSGIDTLFDESGTDTLAFGAGITPGMLTLGLGSLLIEVGDGGDAIHIEGFNPYDVYGTQVIENFAFADNTSLTYEELIALGIHIYGSDGDDEVYGTNGPDIIDGGMGNDYIFGDAGNDTYIFGRGYGHDMFAEYDETAGNIDTVRFAADIAPGDVTVSGENGDLILSINDTDDQVVLQYWFWDDESKIEQVAFADGTVWDIAALEGMVPMAEATADADLIFGTSGDDSIDGLGGNDEIIGGSGNDVLRGGEGDDYLIGDRGNDILLGGEGADELEDWSGSDYLNAGSGDDSIIVNGGASFVIGGSGIDWIENFSEAMVIAFNAGDGQDTIYAASSLTLSLGGGIHAADLSFRREGTDLVLETGITDSIRFTRQWEQDPEAWPQMTLQLIDGAVSTYDLNKIINKYNELQNTDSTLTTWQIGDALASAQLDSSTEFALGGDLAYRYASTGSNDGLASEIIRGIVSDPAFGVDPQPFEAAAPALTGTAGDDVLTGSDGSDTLIGGAGNDTLVGGAGNDTYVFDPGSGVDVIQDSAGMDTVAFSAGITPEMLTLGLGSLLIKVGDGGDAIHIEGFDPSNVYSSPVIENFAFSNGMTLTYNDLLARGFDLAGSDGDDVITGTNVADRINGLGGNDTLSGGEGDDALDGGAGSDALNGGAGSDTYFFGLNSGSDRIEDQAGDLDTIVLGDTIAPGDLTVTRTDDVLTIRIDATGDELALRWQPQDGYQIEQVQFADGTAWDAATLEAQVNHAPLIGSPLAALDATEDAPFAFMLPSDVFFDPDTDDALTISATLADGSPLPEWLIFDGAGFSGTPENADVGGVEVEVTATDGGGLSVSDAFVLNVVNVNDAPTLANTIAGQDTLEDAVFSFVVLADAFADVDVGDVLTYGATLADGSALPAWLSFDATQAAFSGTPENGDVGTFEVRVTATDQSGAYVSNDFTLIVGNTNDAPEVANVINDQSTLEDEAFSFTLPADTFANVDVGDALTFSATLADGSPLPEWLTFDPATQAFTGTPGNDQVGTLSVTVTATDSADARAADTFDLTVVNVNDAPVLINHQQNQWIADGDAMQFQLPGNTFNDIDAGDTLSYAAAQADGTPLPAWLAFDAETRTFSGTPDEADIGTVSLSVTATDTSGATASDSFELDVTVAPDRMLTGTGSDDRLSGRSGSDTLYGLAGDDALFGRSGNDRLGGGPGDDLLAGGTGDDIYVYQAGDGLDTIADEAGSDTAAFGAGLTRDNVVARMSGDYTTARVRVLDAYGNEQSDQGLDIALDAGGDSPVEWFTFATSAPATLDDLLIRQAIHYGTQRNDDIRTGRNDDLIYADRGNDTVYAGTGNDVVFGDRGRDILYGEAGNDVLIGGRGKDQLYGGFGDDVLEGGRGTDILDGGAGFNTYVFERNFGDDRIVRGSGSGALRFGDGISTRDLSFKRRNNDLVVKVKGEGRVRIEGWFDKNAVHQVEFAEFADGTVLGADKFVTSGNDTERERDEDDDDDDVSHYGNDDNGSKLHGASKNDDRDEIRTAKSASGKHNETSDRAWFDKVAEKWNGHYARTTQPNAERDDARSGASRGTQPVDRWQRMHDRLSAHLADGHDDADNSGADLVSLKPGSAHGASFAQFGTIGYGGLGVKDRGAADLRPFTGLKEGLSRIA